MEGSRRRATESFINKEVAEKHIQKLTDTFELSKCSNSKVYELLGCACQEFTSRILDKVFSITSGRLSKKQLNLKTIDYGRTREELTAWRVTDQEDKERAAKENQEGKRAKRKREKEEGTFADIEDIKSALQKESKKRKTNVSEDLQPTESFKDSVKAKDIQFVLDLENYHLK